MLCVRIIILAVEPQQEKSNRQTSVDPAPRSVGTLVGLVLWRGGVYFTSGYLAFVGSRWVLAVLFDVGVPTPLLVSASLVTGGLLLVLISTIVERIQDARAEAGLKDLY